MFYNCMESSFDLITLSGVLCEGCARRHRYMSQMSTCLGMETVEDQKCKLRSSKKVFEVLGRVVLQSERCC